jgi:hypothetical protein
MRSFESSLIAHDNEMMQKECILDALSDLAGERAVQVDAADFGAESAREGSNQRSTQWSIRKLAFPEIRPVGIGFAHRRYWGGRSLDAAGTFESRYYTGIP